MKSLLLMLGMTATMTSCEKEQSARTLLNVSYGTSASQKMDIYLPEGRTSSATKVMVLIHGGGWSSGDKNDFTGYVDTLKKRLPGYAIFNINYRLATASANLFPTQENDVKEAIAFIQSKRSEYIVSDKFVLLGASAGAHLALLQAYKHPGSADIKAVVDFFGPVDMVQMYNNPASVFAPPSLIAGLLGGTPQANPSMYQASGPINFVSTQSPPTIILHGGADILVSPNQSALLKDKLSANGVAFQYVFYPAENHGWAGASMIDSFDKIVAFLNLHVN